MFRWSSSVLRADPASDVIRLEESGPASKIQVNQLRKLPFIVSSDVYSVFEWSRAAVIIFHVAYTSLVLARPDMSHWELKEL